VLLHDVWELLGRVGGVSACLFRDRLTRLVLSGLPVVVFPEAKPKNQPHANLLKFHNFYIIKKMG